MVQKFEMTQPNKYLDEESQKSLKVNLMIFDIMYNNEICNLVYLHDITNDNMIEKNEELKINSEYSDADIEHLIRYSSSFISSMTNFFHRKFDDSLSLEV